MGNDEIKKAPQLGDFILCKMCGQRHKIEYGKKVLPDGSKIPSKLLAFYKCGDNSYLGGINGKDVTNAWKGGIMNIIRIIRQSVDKLEKWEISPEEFINQCRYALDGLLATEKEQKVFMRTHTLKADGEGQCKCEEIGVHNGRCGLCGKIL